MMGRIYSTSDRIKYCLKHFRLRFLREYEIQLNDYKFYHHQNIDFHNWHQLAINV
jgi:hypothetical protein